MNGMRRGVTRRSVAASSAAAVDASVTEALQLAVTETGHEVVVHHADGLHERVADGGSDEVEPALHEGFAHAVRLACARGQVPERAPVVLLGRSTDEAPEKRPERPFPSLKREETTGVRDRRLDLLAVAHDARMLSELGDLLAVVACHALGIEAVEDLEEASALCRIVRQENPAWKPSSLNF